MRFIVIFFVNILLYTGNYTFGVNKCDLVDDSDSSKTMIHGFVPKEWLKVRIEGKDFRYNFGPSSSRYYSQNIDTVVNVENGQFTFVTSLSIPLFFRVNGIPTTDFRAFGVIDSRYAGFHLLVEPSDSLILHFAVANKYPGDYTFGLRITGKGAEKFWCAQQIVNNVGLFNYPIYKPHYDKDYEGDRYLLIDSIMKVSRDVLETINQTINLYKGHISENAMNIIKAQYIPMLCKDIDEFFLLKTGLKCDDEASLALYNKYTSLISNSISTDSSVLYSPHGYKELILKKLFVEYCIKHQESESLQIEDFSYDFYRYLSERIKYAPLKNWIICYYLWNQLYRYNNESVSLYEAVNDFVRKGGFNYPKNRLRAILEEEYRKYAKSIPGKVAYNFNLPDTNMVYHKLEDYKGKLVLIDFMFTGCKGCTLMVPTLKMIEEEYKNEDIKFISISISKFSNLKPNIDHPAFVPGSIYLYTEDSTQHHPVIENYNVVTYPTLILIDKDGQIIERFRNIYGDRGASLRKLINENL